MSECTQRQTLEVATGTTAPGPAPEGGPMIVDSCGMV